MRRRLETEKQQAATYATTAFARDMLAIKDHLERALNAVSEELRADKVASNFLAGIEVDAARAGRGVQPATASAGSRRWASSSTRTSTRR